MSEIKQSIATVSEWHMVSRHFVKSVGNYSDKQIAVFFDTINGKRLEPGCTQGFIGKSSSVGTGVIFELGVCNAYEGARWWESWDIGRPGSNLFCLTNRLSEYLEDPRVAACIEKRLTAYKTKVEQMKQMRLKLDLSVFESQILAKQGIVQFSDIFKTELVRHSAENDLAHEYRVLRTVMTVFQKYPVLQPGARMYY